MLKEAIEKIASMAKNEVHEVNNEFYSDKQLCHIEKIVHRPKEISFNTLNSIITVIKSEKILARKLPLFVDVSAHNVVHVFTSYTDKYQRDYMYKAEADLPYIKFNNFVDHEQAMIMFQSLFVQNDDINYLLKLLSKVSDESKVQSTDNGVTQTVEVKKGVSLLEKMTIKPRVKLAPYRTFLEVEQPESEFILRVQEGACIGIFEADGGMWKLDAKKNIKSFLEEGLKEEIEKGEVIITA